MKKKGITSEMLAASVGVSQRTIGNILAGKTERSMTLINIMKKLHISLADIS